MTQPLLFQLVLSLVTGVILGVFFFGGLWFTIKHLSHSRYPWLLFLFSALSRTAITLAGFWYAGVWLAETGRWQRLLACLIGFMIARYACTRQLKQDQTSLPGGTA